MKRLQSPNSQYLAVISGSRISVWDERTEKPVCFLVSRSDFSQVVWSPNGDVLIASTQKGEVRSWAIPGGNLTVNWSPLPNSAAIKTICCSPYGTYVAALTESQSVLIWDVLSGDLVAQFGVAFSANQLLWSNDEIILSTDVSPICWWDCGTVQMFSVQEQSVCLEEGVSSRCDAEEDLLAVFTILSKCKRTPSRVKRFAKHLVPQTPFRSVCVA